MPGEVAVPSAVAPSSSQVDEWLSTLINLGRRVGPILVDHAAHGFGKISRLCECVVRRAGVRRVSNDLALALYLERGLSPRWT